MKENILDFERIASEDEELISNYARVTDMIILQLELDLDL